MAQGFGALCAAVFAACFLSGCAAGPPSSVEARVAEAGRDVARVSPRVRVCVGPARAELAGGRSASLVFGGEGCGAQAFDLIGVKLVRESAGHVRDPGLPHA